MVQTHYLNNKTYWGFKDDYGKIQPFQLGIFATSGHGKGLSSEAIAEEWKKETGGVVICLADPKGEAEGSFVQYLPKEQYHVNQLKLDGMKPEAHPCKMYHPFTFNIPKQYLPEINFFTVPIKSMTREDWSILAESSFDSEAIKLMMRVASDLPRNSGLYDFLHSIERLTSGKKAKRKALSDAKNWYLHSGGGTAKSVAEIGNLLSPFRKNYLLRKETCEMKLDWKEILNDSENYHVFLSMWLKDEKLQQFMVLNLLNQIIANIHLTKKPILLLIPEVKALCPRLPQGYKYFLSHAITRALVTIRSKGRGMSSITDSQNWSDTDDKVKGACTITFFGNLNPKDREVVGKACSYGKNVKAELKELVDNPCGYLRYDKEGDGIFRVFMPRHMHKEPEYNWIEMYRKHFSNKMVKYDELIKQMRDEFNAEEVETREFIERKLKREAEAERRREEAKEEVKKAQESENKPKAEKVEVVDKNKETIMKLCWEKKKENPKLSYTKIGKELNIHHSTVKKYIELWNDKLDAQKEAEGSPEIIEPMIGEGVMAEEIDTDDTDNETVNDTDKGTVKDAVKNVDDAGDTGDAGSGADATASDEDKILESLD